MSRRLPCVLALLVSFVLPASRASAQDPGARVLDRIEARRAEYSDVAMQLWNWAELGFQEDKSSKALQRLLEGAGFRVTANVAGMPTGFTAEWGSGKPVIAVFGEFDALPGLSQKPVAERQPVTPEGAGHACGHHAFGVSTTAAAIGAKEFLEATKTTGTIRFYGSPAEEGGGGKLYMIRAGLLDDVDTAIAMHPGDANDASATSTLAVIIARFRFHGIAAHAAGAPERGRSALDGMEAFNMMINLMREHVPQETRMHYAIFKGGQAPNVVPDFTEGEYIVRHPDMRTLDGIWERVVSASKGAAMGTGTTVDHEVLSAYANVLPNEVLGRAMDIHLRRVGGYTLTPDERAFAEALQQTLPDKGSPLSSVESVQPFRLGMGGGSTDMGDVSWVVPTVQMRSAIFVPGVGAHTWQATASGGTTIGMKGMMVAAKSMALMAIDLFSHPDLIAKARAEFETRRGSGYTWTSRIGSRQPPTDFRK